METINLLDIIDKDGEIKIANNLFGFSCPVNQGIENFIKNRALEFAKRKISITYLAVTYL